MVTDYLTLPRYSVASFPLFVVAPRLPLSLAHFLPVFFLDRAFFFSFYSLVFQSLPEITNRESTHRVSHPRARFRPLEIRL